MKGSELTITQLTTRQVGYTAAAFITAAGLLTKGLYMFLRQDSWIAIILGYIISLLLIWMYGALNKWYPSKSIVEINEAVFGKIAGSIISALYVFYFFTLVILNLRDMGSFARFILPATPTVLVLILFVFICSWAVRKGAWNITSYGATFVVLSLFLIVVNTVLLIGDIKLDRFMPTLALPPIKYMAGIHLTVALSLGEIITFFMFVPYLKKSNDLGKLMLRGLTIGAAALLFIVSRDITVLGDSIVFLAVPTYAVARMVSMGEFLTRVEIVYAVILIALMFVRINVLLFATVTAAGRLMKFESYGFLVRVFGAFSILYALSVFGAEYEHAEWTNRAAPFYSTFFVILMPTVTLITAAIRRQLKRQPSKEGSN